MPALRAELSPARSVAPNVQLTSRSERRPRFGPTPQASSPKYARQMAPSPVDRLDLFPFSAAVVEIGVTQSDATVVGDAGLPPPVDGRGRLCWPLGD